MTAMRTGSVNHRYHPRRHSTRHYGGAVADAHWLLRGEGMLAWVARPAGWKAPLPAGSAALPGPAAVVAMRYDDTPVGPYLELSVLVPARLGLRPGMCTVAMAVTSPEARLECRRSWGLPAELGQLRWSADGDDSRTLTWDERGFSFTASAHGPAVLAPLVPVRSAAWRPSGPVVLVRRLRARVRSATCDLAVDGGDEFEWLAGRHRGIALAGARIAADAARRPAGLLSSVPWRERAAGAPEPAG